jgi:tetratricopeptide (TPR) repeat protein
LYISGAAALKGCATDVPASFASDAQTAAADPDALYAQRETLASAQQAADIWAARLRANAGDFEAAWKLARTKYWLGGHAPQEGRRTHLEEGIAAARAAIAVQPNRPEGHFWLAANMGSLAESFGLRAGIKYRKPIKEALETVLRIDPAYQSGSADRALGRWYFKVPGLFGGSDKKSEEYLRKSLTYDPRNHASLFFLAETLADMDRKAEARTTLQTLLDAPIDPAWGPEDHEFKQKAKQMLAQMR